MVEIEPRGPMEAWQGVDVSWLAIDGDGRLGWFVTNGSGWVPREIATDEAGCCEQEELLTSWLRSVGLRFEFGQGSLQWEDATTAGVFAYDYSPSNGCFVKQGEVSTPVELAALPDVLKVAANRIVRSSIRFSAADSLAPAELV